MEWLPSSNEKYPNSRRHFIEQTTKAALVSAGVLAFPGIMASPYLKSAQPITVGDIMDLVYKEITGAPFADTVDTLKSGSRDMQVTGVITTMFATRSIIEQAAQLGANFIIAHEPTFYNHTDDKKWAGDNHIVQQKEQLLQEKKIAVWRLHDYIHSFHPDGVFAGVVKQAGWTAYFKNESPVLEMPVQSLGSLVNHLKKALAIDHLRVIGHASHPCRRVAMIPGAAGGQVHLKLIEKERPDVLIVGEIHEWETGEYIRDSFAFGGKTALVVLGHSVSEEPGMQWFRDWLAPRIPGVNVRHIVSGSPFS